MNPRMVAWRFDSAAWSARPAWPRRGEPGQGAAWLGTTWVAECNGSDGGFRGGSIPPVGALARFGLARFGSRLARRGMGLA